MDALRGGESVGAARAYEGDATEGIFTAAVGHGIA